MLTALIVAIALQNPTETPNPSPSPVEITVPQPTSTPQTCDEQTVIGGTVHVIDTAGISYTLTSPSGSSPLGDVDMTGLPAGTYTVAATPAGGYTIDGPSAFTVTVDAAICPAPAADVTATVPAPAVAPAAVRHAATTLGPATTTTLPFTGDATSRLLLGGLTLIATGAGAVAISRRRNTHRSGSS